MGREADPEGFNMWLDLLETGAWNREQVFDVFAQSNEFGSICEAYGIIR